MNFITNILPVEDVCDGCDVVNKEKITITIVNDDGAEIETLSVYSEDAFYYVAKPEKVGYTFAYWKDSDGYGYGTSRFTFNKDTTLTACYRPNTYTINFHTNGGSEIASTSKNFGEQLTLSIPTKDGFQFAGWYTNDKFEGNSLSEITITIDRNIIDDDKVIDLYAKWTPATN